MCPGQACTTGTVGGGLVGVDHPFDSLTKGVQGDHRWAGPTLECMCGCTMFMMLAVFDEDTRLPGFFLTDGMCVSCNALVRLPTPIDEAPDGGLIADLPPVTMPVEMPEPMAITLDLTCPQCGSDEDTVVMGEDEAGVWARCGRSTCWPGSLFNAERDA